MSDAQEQSIPATAKHGASVWGGIRHSGLNLSKKAIDGILRKEMTITGSWNASFESTATLAKLQRLVGEA